MEVSVRDFLVPERQLFRLYPKWREELNTKLNVVMSWR